MIREVVFGFISEAESRATNAIELVHSTIVFGVAGLIEAVSTLITTTLDVFFEDIVVRAIRIVFDVVRSIATAALGAEEEVE